MRSRQFNVTPDVYEAYWIIARASAKTDGMTGLLGNPPDEIANAVLRNYLEQKYPKLLEQIKSRQKQVDELDKQLIEQLTNGRSN